MNLRIDIERTPQMRILLVGDDGTLLETLTRSLGPAHDLLVLGNGPDLLDPAVAAVMADREAVIYCPPPALPSTDNSVLQRAAGIVYNLVTSAPQLRRLILLSSLQLFRTCPVHWRVNEDWRPRPTSALDDLVYVAAESVARELSRVRPLLALSLRLGEVTSEAGRSSPAAVHVDDVAHAVNLALRFQPAAKDSPYGWWPFHIAGGGPTNQFTIGSDTRTKLGYEPRYDLTGGTQANDDVRCTPRSWATTKLPRKAVVFGAHGPLGSAFVQVLEEEWNSPVELLLTDVVTIDDAMARPLFNRGAPVPTHHERHRTAVVDVRDFEQVWQATEGMDAIVNLTAGRRLPELAFGVNTLGTYNIMKAAVERGIRRVVHTGPEVLSSAGTGRAQAGYWPDFDVPADAPPRASTSAYFLSKQVGSEICRIFAEEHDMEVPALFYGNFRNPLDADDDILDGFPICVSWRDGADAVARALTTPHLKYPYEAMNIVADLPQRKLCNSVAKERLGWEPKDSFERFWTR
jgi:nucleoside-diphosphate-sugar epimerase